MSTLLEAPTADVAERREHEWLVFTAARGASDVPWWDGVTSETLLAWNAALSGAAKFILTDELQVALQAELPCADGAAEDAGRTATARGLQAAQHLWRADPSVPLVKAWPVPLAPSSELMEAFAEADWPVTRESDNSLVAALEVREFPSHVRVVELGGGKTLLWSELAVMPVASHESREAVARFLLLAGGKLRWARPTVYAMADWQAAGFEILLPAVPTAIELVMALGALSVGCQLCAAETAALLHEPVALEFIRVTTPVPFRLT